MSVIEQAINMYRDVWNVRYPLARILLFWYVLAAVTQLASGTYDAGLGAADSLDALSGTAIIAQILHLLTILLGWYAAHRYMMNPEPPQSYLPEFLMGGGNNRSLQFIAGQVANMFLLLALSLLVLLPLTVYLAMNAVNITEQEAQHAQDNISLLFFPLAVLFFSRLLLVAPMSARGEAQSVRRSWRITRGHFIRLTILQLSCMLPLFVAGAGAWLFIKLGSNPVTLLVSALVGAAAALFSIVLYARLAEDEYAKLVRS